MTVTSKEAFNHIKQMFDYEKRVRELIKTPVGINTPITENNKEAVINARKVAAKETGYDPAKLKISIWNEGKEFIPKTYGEDIYGNPRYTPYEYPVWYVD